MRGVEIAALAFALLTLAGLRLTYLFHHRVDSDEPQHLHVVWGWTQGLVQYRDFFDNHAPLFHLIMAPLLGRFGEREDIWLVARVWMLPLVGASLWAVYLIGSALWSKRVGVWGAVLGGLAPGFLLLSTEFRTDVLWMASWFAALVVILGGSLDRRRAFSAGLLLGVALAISLKSILLILALALAGGIVAVLLNARGEPGALRAARRVAPAWLAGMICVPGVILLVFWRLHALGDLYACTLKHNVVPGLGFWHSSPFRFLLFPVAAVLLTAIAHRMLRVRASAGLQSRRTVLALALGFYLALLVAFWPLITEEDFLPSTPLLMMLLTAAVDAALAWVRRRRPQFDAIAWGAGIASLVVVLDVFAVNRMEPALRDDSRNERQLLSDVVRLTRPGEPIMDLKGETIFRPRPCYYVLEGITKARLAMGLLPDRIASDVVRTRTHFAVPDDRNFPPAARAFLNEHFVKLGSLRVLGTEWARAPGAADSLLAFDVSYRERFGVLADGAAAGGALDGTPYRGPRRVEPGRHTYRPRPGERRITVIWQGALDRGLVSESNMAAAR